MSIREAVDEPDRFYKENARRPTGDLIVNIANAINVLHGDHPKILAMKKILNERFKQIDEKFIDDYDHQLHEIHKAKQS